MSFSVSAFSAEICGKLTSAFFETTLWIDYQAEIVTSEIQETKITVTDISAVEEIVKIVSDDETIIGLYSYYWSHENDQTNYFACVTEEVRDGAFISKVSAIKLWKNGTQVIERKL
jgi:hypothetical protein